MLSFEMTCAFFVASLLMAMTPGPDVIIVLTQSSLYGMRAGVLTTLGLMTGLLGHTLAVALGVAVLFQTSEAAFTVSEGRYSDAFRLLSEVAAHKRLQQLVAIQLADQRAGVVMVRDIGGVLRQDVAHDLVDGIIALILQRGINGGQNMTDLSVLFLRNIKLSGKFFHWESPSFPCRQYSNAISKSKESAVNCNQIVMFP